MKDVTDRLAPELKRANLPIVLIGMMGSGKTHFGRLIAQSLGLEFFDSDSLIEQKAGCSVTEIFERWGEAKFREVEAATIQEYLERGALIMATGGGAVMNTETAQAIFQKSIAVWVQANMDDILARVSKNKNRPLLACADPEDVLQKLMQVRAPIYAQAPIKLDSSNKDQQKVMDDIYSEVLMTLKNIENRL